MKSAIIVCSGGIDSVVTAHHVKKELDYDKIIILFFNYGQRSSLGEKRCAEQCARDLNATFYEINLDYLRDISSSLITEKKEHARLSREDLRDTKKEGARWYVPCRNLIFLSNALAIAESRLVKEKINYDIFVGFKSEGKEPFPDATQEFVLLMNEIGMKTTNGSFKIFSPLIEMDKEDIVSLGEKLGVDFKCTISCYVSDIHCGTCLACRLRQEGFYWANMYDPTNYTNK